MSKRFLAILLICAAAFVGLFLLNGKNAEAPSTNEPTTTTHSTGGQDAKVTLIEYGDFQCPACASYYPIMKEVKAHYGDKINFQFRNFPLVSIHPNALAAHRAAEAASNQDKFWEMHDMLYERRDNWINSSNPSQIFESYATELGLDIAKFKQDVSNPATKAKIDADYAEGRDAGVDSTPGFVMNGKKIDNNPRDAAGFYALIDPILNEGQAQ